MDEAQHDYVDLLERVRCRDAAAAEMLVEALYPVVMIVIQRRMPRGADPRDLAQEVMVKVLNGLSAFRGAGDSLPAWARRIAFRVCLNEWRRRKSRPELLWSDLTEEQAVWVGRAGGEGAATPSEAMAARELVTLLLDQLRPEERLIVELSELEELGPKSIGELTGWSPLNIRVRRFRARRKLRRLLERLKGSAAYE